MTNLAAAARKHAPIFLVAAFALLRRPSPHRRRSRAAASPSVRSSTLRASIRSRSASTTPRPHRRRRDLRHAHHARRQGRGRSRSSHCPGPIPTTSRPGPSSCAPASNSTTARRSMRSGKENFDRQKDPANNCRCAFYIANINERAGARRTDGRLQSQRSVGELAGDDDASRPEQRRAFADGVEDQGRRLQPQSGRHRSLHPEILDRRRPHGAGEEPGLLGQGPVPISTASS